MHRDNGPAAGRRLHREGAAQQRRPFLHAEEPEARALLDSFRRGGPDARAVIGDDQLDAIAMLIERYKNPLSVRVPDCIGQRLLCDAEQG